VVKTRFAHGVPFSAKADSALPGVAAFLNATSSIRATFVSSSRRGPVFWFISVLARGINLGLNKSLNTGA
jgi:hypothetical protein